MPISQGRPLTAKGTRELWGHGNALYFDHDGGHTIADNYENSLNVHLKTANLIVFDLYLNNDKSGKFWQFLKDYYSPLCLAECPCCLISGVKVSGVETLAMRRHSGRKKRGTFFLKHSHGSLGR